MYRVLPVDGGWCTYLTVSAGVKHEGKVGRLAACHATGPRWWGRTRARRVKGPLPMRILSWGNAGRVRERIEPGAAVAAPLRDTYTRIAATGTATATGRTPMQRARNVHNDQWSSTQSPFFPFSLSPNARMLLLLPSHQTQAAATRYSPNSGQLKGFFYPLQPLSYSYFCINFSLSRILCTVFFMLTFFRLFDLKKTRETWFIKHSLSCFFDFQKQFKTG